MIGIDAGTSVIKSVAFSVDGTQLASAAMANKYETFSDGAAEQDMARTWFDISAVQQKLFSDFATCANTWVEPTLGAATEPDAQLTTGYEKTFPLYVEARKAMRQIWRGWA